MQIKTAVRINLDPYLTRAQNELKIDHRSKCNFKTIKLLEEKMGVNLHDKKWFLRLIKEKTKLPFTKMKNCVSKDTIKKVKDNAQNGGKFLQITNAIKDSYLEYTKNWQLHNN